MFSKSNKWDAIISAFDENRIDNLKSIHRTGSRGRILSHLVKKIFDCLNIHYQAEPIFNHKPPNEWYANFASNNGITLRSHDFYNPDFLLDDGSWVEITLSENTAYKKLFRHGHQADYLKIIWIDNDDGLHKQVCQHIKFPNAVVVHIDRYYDQLRIQPHGQDIINNIELLISLKGIIA